MAGAGAQGVGGPGVGDARKRTTPAPNTRYTRAMKGGRVRNKGRHPRHTFKAENKRRDMAVPTSGHRLRTPPPPGGRGGGLRRKTKLTEEARNWRPILGTQTFFFSRLTSPPMGMGGWGWVGVPPAPEARGGGGLPWPGPHDTAGPLHTDCWMLHTPRAKAHCHCQA